MTKRYVVPILIQQNFCVQPGEVFRLTPVIKILILCFLRGNSPSQIVWHWLMMLVEEGNQFSGIVESVQLFSFTCPPLIRNLKWFFHKAEPRHDE